MNNRESYRSQLTRGRDRLLRQPAAERNPHKMERIQDELRRLAASPVESRLSAADDEGQALHRKNGEIITCDRCSKPAILYHCRGVDIISGGVVYTFHCADHP